jgi:type IV pilus assembly protein PilW
MPDDPGAAMTKQRSVPVRRPARERGRTLIEVMVAITIGLMLTAGVLSIYGANRQTYRASADVQRMQAAGQLALDRLAYQVRMAGYGQMVADFALQPNPSTFTGQPLQVCSGGFTNPTTATTAAPACVGNAAQPDAIAVSYFVGVDGPATAGSAESRDCLGTAITTANTAQPGEFAVLNRFYVANSNGVSTLMCAGNDGVAAPLVPNIVDLNVRVRVGQPFTRAERSYEPQDVPDWTRVLGLELCVLVQSDNIGVSSGQQAGTDCRGAAYPNDGRLRRTFTQVVTLRNRVL